MRLCVNSLREKGDILSNVAIESYMGGMHTVLKHIFWRDGRKYQPNSLKCEDLLWQIASSWNLETYSVDFYIWFRNRWHGRDANIWAH